MVIKNAKKLYQKLNEERKKSLQQNYHNLLQSEFKKYPKPTKADISKYINGGDLQQNDIVRILSADVQTVHPVSEHYVLQHWDNDPSKTRLATCTRETLLAAISGMPEITKCNDLFDT